MEEIRIHGRGGQGSVTAAFLLAEAAFYDGKYAQAFPSFGVERRGAPVASFVRISDTPIRLREQIYHPDYVIIQDASLIPKVDVFSGIKKNTLIIINTEKSKKELLSKIDNKKISKNIFLLPATEIALKIIKKPIVNTIMIGAFVAVTNLINFDSLKRAIKERFPKEIAKQNIKAVEFAFKYMKKEIEFKPKIHEQMIENKERFAVSS